MATCPTAGQITEDGLSRLITQYREATKFKGMLSAYLDEIDLAARSICAIPDYFDINTATADQLTLIGKRLGWPRCHCVCVSPPVFGFECEAEYTPYTIAGFCDEGSTWVGCGEVGQGQICLDNDEIYRSFLKVRIYQYLGLYDVESLTACVQIMWGSAASVIESAPGSIVLAPSRALSSYEMTILPVALRVMPVAPGIRILTHIGDGPIFGFGSGWHGFCETPSAEWLCPEHIDPYSCA